MERTDQIIELISKANQSFDSGVIRDGQKLTREALKLVKIQGKIPNKLKHKLNATVALSRYFDDISSFATNPKRDKLVNKIKKIDNNNYIGTAPDVVGEATGVQYGSAFKFKYDLLVPFKNKNIKVSFDDWIFKQDEKVAINRATLTKFGFKVGELTVFFMRD